MLIHLCKCSSVNIFCNGANGDIGQYFVLISRFLPVYSIVIKSKLDNRLKRVVDITINSIAHLVSKEGIGENLLYVVYKEGRNSTVQCCTILFNTWI